jgi:Fe2+ or Zn2+ uptake regulation protein
VPSRRRSAARTKPAAPREEHAVRVYVPPEATAHAICRRCGRIVRVAVSPEEVAQLNAFADRRPDGWTVEGMTFSFTGLCSTCRGARRD